MPSRRVTAALAIIAVAVVAGAAAAFALTGSDSPHRGYGQAMMDSRYSYQPATTEPVRTLDEARANAQKFADTLGLKVDEVMQFQQNFYAKLVDGNGDAATEVLVDPSTGAVSIEYGPAMMWNTRYGMSDAADEMMGTYGRSMMQGQGNGTPAQGRGMMDGSVETTVTIAQAHTLAQQWLDQHEPGVTVESGGDAFPGYYTLETLRDGKITGMISVNASTGVIWHHWWHGTFIAKA